MRASRAAMGLRLAVALSLSVLSLGLAACAAIVSVPDLRGTTLATARDRLESAGLELGHAAYDPSSTGATWTVVQQSRATTAPAGSEVDVVLAGPRPVAVPELVGVPVSDARSVLTAAGLVCEVGVSAFDPKAPKSTVASATPAAGELVPAGSTVRLVPSRGPQPPASDGLRLKKVDTLSGALSTKSVVACGDYVFAQNMIYRHTVSVFDARRRTLVKTIKDSVTLADFGFAEYTAPVKGGPVEAAPSADGSAIYVSNYSMYGPGFAHPGDDTGGPGSGVDDSFVYRIPLDSLRVDQVIKVGAVPKYLAATPDGRLLLVSNWISYSVSVVEVASGREIRRIKTGPHPRGIAITQDSRFAYIAVMGSTALTRIDLRTFETSSLPGIGLSPRHVVLAPDDRFLYATLDGSSQVVKIDLETGKVVARVKTGTRPRSMVIAPDGLSLYVVNYESNTMSKVRTSDMSVIQELPTGSRPIGIAYVDSTSEVWVSCYTGTIAVYEDR